MVHEPLRAEQPEFLAAEVRDDDRSARGMRGEQPRQLEHGGGARGVVVRAVPDRVARLGIHRAEGGAPEVVEVRADDDVLVAQRGIASLDQPDDVLRRQPGRVTGVCPLRAPRTEPLQEVAVAAEWA